jgi:hypothetical protein
MAFQPLNPSAAAPKPTPSFVPLSGSVSAAAPKAPVAPNLGQLDAAQVKEGANKIVGAVKTGAARFAASPSVQKGDTIGTAIGKEAAKTGDLLETGLNAAAGGAQAFFAPFTATLQKLLSAAPPGAGKAVAGAVHPATKALSAWAAKNPRAAQDLGSALTVALSGAGDVLPNVDLGQAAKDFSGAISGSLTPKTIDLTSSRVLDAEGDPISSISSKVAEGEKSFSSGPVDAIQLKDGSIMILDGQHRAAEAIASGAKNIDVNFLSKEDAVSKYSGLVGDPSVFESVVDPAFKGSIARASSSIKDTSSDLASAKTGIDSVAKNQEELQSIAQNIMPGATKKAVQQAMSEGRIIKGAEAGLIKGGTADSVAPSADVVKAAQTIQEQIPGAAKMNDQELYTALDTKISDTAKKLSGVMKETPVDESTFQQINDDWSSLKKTQLEEAKATDEPNVLKWQQNFEKIISKGDVNNLDDLWQMRKDYDASIKANVKNATDLSPEDLQTQKEIWLQNRRILNTAINNATEGLPTESQKAFSDMSDMYTAQQNLLGKAKLAKPSLSRAAQFLKSPKGQVLKAAAEGAGALELGKKVITGSF